MENTGDKMKLNLFNRFLGEFRGKKLRSHFVLVYLIKSARNLD
jgi:hypothetical protein